MIPQTQDWRCELLRFTCFTTEPLTEGSLSWWKDVFGMDPESTASKRPLGIHTAERDTDGIKHMLILSPGRVDWTTSVSPSLAIEAVMPDIGNYQAAFDAMSGKLSKWLKQPPIPVIRVALGALVRVPVQDKVDGYKLLGKLLPTIRIDPEGSSDFLYQINRPKSSAVIQKLKINRLSRWAVSHLESTSMPLPIPGSIYCRIELDFNSDPLWKEVLSPSVSNLFAELGRECADAIASGDKV